MGEQFTRRRRRWEPDEIVARLQEWDARYGSPPTSMDWNPTLAKRLASKHAARARRWSRAALRFESDEWPWQASVTRVFGSWNAALRAAGFEPRRASPREIVVDPLDLEALLRMVGVIRQAHDEERHNSLAAALYEMAERAVAWGDEVSSEREEIR